MMCSTTRRLRTIAGTRRSKSDAARRGFTLVELLVVMAIITLLAVLMLGAFQKNDAERLRASARTLQSYLEGARSQARSQRRNVGVRLVRSPTDPFIATGLVYVGSTEYLTGTVDIAWNTTNGWVVQNNAAGEWPRMADVSVNPNGRDLLKPGLRMELPRGSGNWFTVDLFMGNQARLVGHYPLSTWNASAMQYEAQPATSVPYRLELAPAPLPNKDPQLFERGMAIDLVASRVPSAWLTSPNVPMDIMFDARGNPTGAIAAGGLIHLYLTTLADVELTRLQFVDHPANGTASPLPPPVIPGNPPVVPSEEPQLVTVFTQTGQVQVSQIDFTDSDMNGRPDSPFRYARRGTEAQ